MYEEMKKIFNILFLLLALIYFLFKILSCYVYYYCGVNGRFFLVESFTYDYYWTIILNSIMLAIAIGIMIFSLKK